MNYLRLTLARKRRFVLNFTTSPLVEGSADDLHITVHLATETGGAASVQTAVRFEIAGYDDPPFITTGKYVEASSARGWEGLAGTEGDGAYAAAVRPERGWVAGQSVMLAMMVETTDARGVSEAERRFPFGGSSVQAYIDMGFSFKPFRNLSVSTQPEGPLSPPSPSPPL